MGQLGFPYISTGNLYTAVDTYNTALLNNGALNPLGTRYTYPLNPASVLSYGTGAPLTIAYVRYNSTSNPNFLAAPGVVYWVDKQFTTVTGLYSESAFGINGIAGYVLPNTASYPGSLTGAQLATVINGNFVFIAVGGYLPGAESITSVAAGDYLIGGTTAFVPVRMTANSAPTNRVLGMATTAIASGVSDVLLGNFGLFTF